MAVFSRLWKSMDEHRAITVVIVLFLVLATAYNLSNPLFESPDELIHYQYIRALQLERCLPVVDVSGPLTEEHQPPLYYVITAVLSPPLSDEALARHTQVNPFWGYEIGAVGHDNKNQYLHPPHPLADPAARKVHWVRAFSTLFGAGTVLLTYWLARRFFAEPLAVACAAVVAFTPNFLLTGAAISNDAMLSLVSAAGGLWLVDVVAREESPSLAEWAALALLLGAGVLVKVGAAPLLPTAALAVGLLAWRLRSWRVFVTAGAILLGGVLIVCGWWVLRNLRLYGDLTGLGAMWAVWGVRDPLTLATYRVELHNFRTTFWANFGYGNVPGPGWLYTLTDVFVIGGLAGLIVGLFRRKAKSDPTRRDQTLVLFSWWAITFTALLWYLQRTAQVTGRQLYAAMPVIALALVGGWAGLIPARWHKMLAWALSALMLAFAVGAWLGILIPAYRPAPRVSPDAVPQPLDWQVGDDVRLLGYDISPPTVDPGQTVTVTLYWEPLDQIDRNYTVFVQLFGLDGARVGGRDTYPGLGNDPTIYLGPGEIIADSIPVPVAPDAEGPILLDVVAGLHDLASGERLPTRDAAGSPVEYPVIGAVKLSGSGHAAPSYEDEAVFQGGLALAGYDLSETALTPGAALDVTLIWDAAGPLPVDYTVFVHLVDEAGQIAAQGDAPPRGGRYPTTTWGAGERFPDPHTLALPADLPPGAYALLVGLYDPLSGARLPLEAGGDHVRLGQIVTIR
jgi:4-amino-4-deoxy-L-arabinose transferase-like glycosyltransferase